jgi:hypothetical protein
MRKVATMYLTDDEQVELPGLAPARVRIWRARNSRPLALIDHGEKYDSCCMADHVGNVMLKGADYVHVECDPSGQYVRVTFERLRHRHVSPRRRSTSRTAVSYALGEDV